MQRTILAATLAVVATASAGAQQFDPAPGVPIKTEAMAKAEAEDAAAAPKVAEDAMSRPLASSIPARRANATPQPRPATPPKQ